jgi:predicted ATPase with chaperone activity
LWVLWLMSVCRARSLSLFGIDALPVEVEVDVSSGLPGFSIVGLPDAAVQEARERVRVAISNSGFKFPTKKVIVNLAPANLRKEGPAFDLPIALGILAASGALPAGGLEGAGVVGQRYAKRALEVAAAGGTTSSRNILLQRICEPTCELRLSAAVSAPVAQEPDVGLA